MNESFTATDQDGNLPRLESRRKSIRSYVVRAGRMTEGQRKAFERFWPEFGLSLDAGQVDYDVVFGRHAPRVLEIGFGMGDSLLQMAAEEPDKDFIGIEVHPPGVGALVNNAGKAGLTNLRIYLADAVDVLNECIPADSLSRIQVYFPDPWHKKKHHKRRIIQPPLVELLASRLKEGGLLHLATDWQAYAEHMSEVLEAEPLLENCADAGALGAESVLVPRPLFVPRPAFRPITKFERRGERLGHGVWDLLYHRKG